MEHNDDYDYVESFVEEVHGICQKYNFDFEDIKIKAFILKISEQAMFLANHKSERDAFGNMVYETVLKELIQRFL